MDKLSHLAVATALRSKSYLVLLILRSRPRSYTATELGLESLGGLILELCLPTLVYITIDPNLVWLTTRLQPQTPGVYPLFLSFPNAECSI